MTTAAAVRRQIGPVTAYKSAVVVDRLPRIRFGTILWGTTACIADGREWQMPATADDPVIFDEIATVSPRSAIRAAFRFRRIALGS